MNPLASSFLQLVTIMDELREQCPWDKKQTIDTLRSMTIEETYELADAITNKDWNGIREELGDVLLHILFYGFFIYLMSTYGWTGRGDAASVHGAETDWLLNLNFVIVIAVFFLTNSLLFIYAWKYVRKPGVKAYFFPHNNKLEMIWTVVPAAVLAVIIILGLKVWGDVTGSSKNDAIQVELFSKQFDWTARYAGKNNKLGKFDYKLTTQENELALLTEATLDSAIRYMEFGKADSTVLGIKLLESKLNNKKTIFIPEDREKMEVDLDRKTRLLRLLYQMKARYDK